MSRFSILLFLSLFFSNPASAFTEDTGIFDAVEFATETDIPFSRNETMDLCRVTRAFQILGVTLSSNTTGYALSRDNCLSIDRPFSAEQVQVAQDLNFLDDSITPEPSNSLQRTVLNYAFWLAIALALIAVIIRRTKSLFGRDLRAPMRKKAADRILEAMCHAGNCDGIVASHEIVLISETAERVTRRDVKPTDVIHVADGIKGGLTAQDFINFGKGLRDSEKDDMMRSVFYITLASGRLLPAEYEFVTDLAYGIGMPGEDFRRVMNLSLADLDNYPPNY